MNCIARDQNSIVSMKPERRRRTAQHVMTVPSKCLNVSAYTAVDKVDIVQEISAIDLQSQYGRFGWPEASTDVYYGIPYILRDSVKYFAVQMILTKLPIRTYLSCLHQDVYKYYFRVIKHPTATECHLFNEINVRHCDSMFGRSLFTIESLTLIRDTDAYELWEFLDTCYRKLTPCMKVVSNKIGFIQFNFTSVYVPFVMRNNEHYMPLYCFSNVNNVPVDYISGWDLAYLRFCCLYQGIWKGSSDIYPVVSLSSMYANLPVDAHFFTCWPLSMDHKLMRKAVPGIGVGNGSEQETGRQNENGIRQLMAVNKELKITIGKPQPVAVNKGSKVQQNSMRKRCGETIDGRTPVKVRRCDSTLQPSKVSSQKNQGCGGNIRKLR
ncbi:uncharacterized protein LOC119078572 [Bradysia coprophila]|uniref:uncharacterized protein LOC119078572 n=1 Tax=Bradysia coprophila TaxID=38358 RepID=UPI00187D94A6|nr:uncharacterized protein LOC119078572 [Bradysia coprophila]